MSPILNDLVKVTHWSSLTSDDEALYVRCFELSNDLYCYENNWAHIVQESRNGGARYWDGQNLLTLVSKNVSSDFVFLFIASFNLKFIPLKIKAIILDIVRCTGKRVILRKSSSYLEKQIRAYSEIHLVNTNEFTLINELPEDIFPQVVVNILPLIQMSGSSWARVRNHINHFDKDHGIQVRDLTVENAQDALNAISEWMSYKTLPVNKTNKPLTFDMSSYRVLVNRFFNKIDNKLYFAKVIYADGVPIAFLFAGRIAFDAAALYSSIVVTGIRGATEKCLLEFCRYLLENKIEYLNLGGSEIQGLFDYKCKFHPFDYVRTLDLEFDLV